MSVCPVSPHDTSACPASPSDKRLAVCAALLLAAASLLAGCSGNARPVPKAVFIVVDGIPADVVESVPTPAIDAIAAQGGYTRAWLGGDTGSETESPTVSAVGYQSLITGTWANKHGVLDNEAGNPDYRYWDIFRIAKAQDPPLHTAIFSTWQDNRTKLVGDGLASAGGHKIDYAYDGLELDTSRFPHEGGDPELDEYIALIDDAVALEAARYLRASGPDLSWVYLQYTDDVGHRFGDGPQMAAAVQAMDRRIAQIARAVAERSGEDWLILVTTDHGRDDADGREHGGQSARERTIWIATNSHRLNRRFKENPAIVDILPSIAAHLRIDIPVEVAAELDGRPFIDP